METVYFSKSSWIYKFLCFVCPQYLRYPPTDICEYTSAFIKAVGKFFFWVVAVGLIIFVIGSLIMASSDCRLLMHSCKSVKSIYNPIVLFLIVELVGILSIGILFAFMVALGVFSVGIESFYRNLYNRVLYKFESSKYHNKQNAFMKMYKSFKDKTCYRIEFK